MPDVIVVSDSAALRAQVKSALDRNVTAHELTRGSQLLPAVREYLPDLAILDLQVGKMGGMAACLDLRLEESVDRLPHIPVLMLLDRRADVFLARRSQADGWLIKPLDALRVRHATKALMAGENYFDETYRPVTVPIPSGSPSTVG